MIWKLRLWGLLPASILVENSRPSLHNCADCYVEKVHLGRNWFQPDSPETCLGCENWGKLGFTWKRTTLHINHNTTIAHATRSAYGHRRFSTACCCASVYGHYSKVQVQFRISSWRADGKVICRKVWKPPSRKAFRLSVLDVAERL